MKRISIILSLICASVTLFAQAGDAAFNQEFTLDIWGNTVRPDNVALPEFDVKSDRPDMREAGKVLTETIRQDLVNSGFFRMIDLSRYASLGSPHRGPIDFDEWGSVEAEQLIVGSVIDQDGSMRVEVRLYEIAARKHILAKAYRGRAKLARKMAHVIADDIMLRLRNIKFATSKLIYTRDMQGDPSEITNKEIFIMDYDGTNPLPITKGGLSFSPTALRNGRDTMLAYSVFENAGSINANYSIFFKPTLLSRPRPLFSDEGKRATSSALSPDGNRIAFSMATEGNVDIYVMNLDGTGFLQLTRHPNVDTNPSWSPGGNAILFTSDRTGSPQIFQMDADGLNVRRITLDNPYNDSAVWNPVYNYVAFVSRFESNFDIFVRDMREGRSFRVTQSQGSNEDPVWSPDGNQLAFTSNRTGSWQIYVVNINGQNLRQVTFTGENRNPVWVSGD